MPLAHTQELNSVSLILKLSIAAGEGVGNNMTIERLYQYRIIKQQKELFEREISYISGVDTTKPSVMSGKTSDTTADNGIKLAELGTEYDRICKEYTELTKYIFKIKDEFVKAVAIRKFIIGQTYNEIGEALFCEKTTARKALKRYIDTHL